MKGLRGVSQTIQGFAQAQADWEIKMSRNVFKSKKKLFLLLLLTVPVIFALTANAAGILPDSIPILGGSKAYMPSYINSTMFFGSILVGLIAGLITGVIGAGGGYILTPALMSFGIRGIMAVGTDQFHLFAKAIMGTTIHAKLGNVNWWLAGVFVIGSMTGVTIGGNISRSVFQYSPAMSDALISTVYVVVLGILGFYSIADFRKAKREKELSSTANLDGLTNFARKLQKLNLPPYIHFDKGLAVGPRRISIYPVIVCGFIVGFVASIMGVGGGFLTFPMFVYGLGVSTFTTVGTDILQIIFTTAYSSITQYAIYGFVFYTISVGMLIGSLVGVQIGAMVTKMVKGSLIRVFFALTILAGFVNRACALPRKLADLGYISLNNNVSVIIENIGTVVFFVLVGIFALWILKVFFKNIAKLRVANGDVSDNSNRLILNPKKFCIGLCGLAIFVLILTAGLLPDANGQNKLLWADNLFNRLAKGSTDYITDMTKKSKTFEGTIIDIGINPREFADKEKLLQLIKKNNFEATVLDDGRIKIVGDLGKLSSAAVADSKLMFDNKKQDIKNKYQFESEDAIYCWWVIFDGLTRRFTQENELDSSNFAKSMTTKVIEPAYNFRGIEAKKFDEVKLPITVLLVIYILYTLLYGFSIMFIFEGLGISVSANMKKEEV